jgi:hypothetical protein
MKKTIILALALFSFNAYSQTEKPFVIEHCIDKMTDKEYFLSTKNFVCANTQKTQGFVITNSFKGVDGKLQQNGIILKNIGVGSCDENDELIFLFEDDSKITITSWNKFNCDGKAYFSFSDSNYDLLKSKKVKAIRFKNGYSYESLTYSLTKEEQSFFVNVYSNNVIKEINCDK